MKVVVSKSKPLDEFEQEFFTAARSGDKDKVMELLGTVDMNIRDKYIYGQTALMYACKRDRKDVVRLLLKAGADPTSDLVSYNLFEKIFGMVVPLLKIYHFQSIPSLVLAYSADN